MDENLLKVGKYDNKFNEILGIEIAEVEIYRSKGLPAHMLKSKHQNCLKYIDYIPDIIAVSYTHLTLPTSWRV